MLNKILLLALLASTSLSCPDEQFCRGCEEVEGRTECGFCEESYLDPVTHLCAFQKLKEVANCKAYAFNSDKSEVAACHACEIGFRLDGLKNECVACPGDCGRCDEENRCLACRDSRMFNPASYSDTSVDPCGELNSCDVFNCEVCGFDLTNGRSTCELCKSGFAQPSDTSNPVCLEVTSPCQVVDEVTKACAICRWGYFLAKDGVCKQNGDKPKPGPGPNPNPDPNPDPKKKTSTWIWILVGLLVIGVGVGAYFFYVKKREDDELYNTV